ncbi:globin domain-containing protein [Sphingobacterium sp. 1.A.5]|uniref:globin domain-containing protein n=1 Tax=Sphingobacterium sp. 1.A.5 TaxID=2044604 RepID=UPI001C55698B|nr:globin domain-containing protein [Sphingobacterium sp. 1.A.5]
MTSDQIQLIKATVPVLREHGVLLTSHFYKRMFENNPELKHIFNMGNQQNNKKQTALAMAVLAYAEYIETPEVLLPVVDHIGHKHTSLDIRPEHYTIVGRHLIASIQEVLGDAATPELLEAWTLAYSKLADLMAGHEQKLYIKQTERTGGWAGWRPFVVKQKVKESEEITSF